ncbi:MAG: preprotein translocase subunit YajC [Clostridiales bacterium]|nr:preprotein translocase subunit YajC [Clostridiales bacterium]
MLLDQTAQQTQSPITMFVLIGALLAMMYFMTIRPQKKKQKEEQAMRDNLQIGDEVTTIGGIVGKIVTTKEDVLIIETGADRNKIKITRWAISTNNTANERAEAEKEAAKKAQEEARQARLEEEGSKSTRKKSKKNKTEEE